MLQFSVIENAQALVRLKRGIIKLTCVYERGEHRYIPFQGGFVRICQKFGDYWPTIHPDIKVIELEVR